MERMQNLSYEENIICALEISQMKQDSESIFQLIPFFTAYPELSYGFIPYLSLFSISVLEFLSKYSNEYFLTDEAQKINQVRIKDVRAKIKVFDSGYIKSRKLLLNVEYIQEQDFKRRNAFYSFLNNGQYPNMSIHLDDKNRVIGNTHFDYYLMQDKRIIDKSLDTVKELYRKSPRSYSFEHLGKDAYNVSLDCGRIIGSILSVLNSLQVPSLPDVKPCMLDLYKSDVNTNHRELFSGNTSSDNSAFLFILHILSATNFILYVINECEGIDTGWWLKVNYLAYYYCITRLRDLETYLHKDGRMEGSFSSLFDKLNLKEEKYLSSILRNSIMHSSFSFENKNIISDLYLNFDVPLFGLVETLFSGAGYFEIKREIECRMTQISTILTEWLDMRLNTELTRDQTERKSVSIDELRGKIPERN